MVRPAADQRSLLLAIVATCGIACSRSDPSPAPKPPPIDWEPPRPVAAAPPPQPPPPAKPPAYDPMPDYWRKAAKRITLLDPDQFPEAPPELRQALKKRGCRIPQSFFTYLGYSEEPHPVQENLVPGHFKSSSEIHWAVLCSKSGKTSLLLFDSLGENMETLEGPFENTHLLVGTHGNDDPDFIWTIEVADKEATLEDYEEDRGVYGDDEPPPPPIFHDALASTNDEASVSVHYWYKCKWVTYVDGC